MHCSLGLFFIPFCWPDFFVLSFLLFFVQSRSNVQSRKIGTIYVVLLHWSIAHDSPGIWTIWVQILDCYVQIWFVPICFTFVFALVFGAVGAFTASVGQIYGGKYSGLGWWSNWRKSKQGLEQGNNPLFCGQKRGEKGKVKVRRCSGSGRALWPMFSQAIIRSGVAPVPSPCSHQWKRRHKGSPVFWA